MGNALKKGNLEAEDINIVITTMDNFECFNLEKEAINSLFNNIPKISFKQLWGDFLGSSAHFGILLASEIIKKQMVPKLFITYEIKTVKKILVNNYDKDGSFTTYIISSVN